MPNRRVPELNELLWDTIHPNDVFLISDISEYESKKIKAGNLKKHVLDGTASYSLRNVTSSHAIMADTASHVVTASYALTCSCTCDCDQFVSSALNAIHSIFSDTASYATTSSYSITASYALTSSAQFAEHSKFSNSASYLIYIPGINNGTASYAIKSLLSLYSNSSSYLIYTPGINNGTASHAITSSNSLTASYLQYNGPFNGTASYAIRSGTTLMADSASVADTVSNPYIYREFDILTASINAGHTASFGWMQVSASTSPVKLRMQAWGDICVPVTGSNNLRLEVYSTYGSYVLDDATFLNIDHCCISGALQATASIQTFFLQGQFEAVPTTQRFSASIFATNALTFYTASRAVQLVVKATTDYFLKE